jgi:hypothetical protein
MSKQLLTVLLSELTLIRVTCKKCRSRATIEIPIDRVDRCYDENKCPLCKENLPRELNVPKNYLMILADAIRNLSQASDLFDIELVVPEAEKSAESK